LRFAAVGYAAFVLQYSCAPGRFPTALREAAMAMDYIRRNAEMFDVDPHMVAALGFSAGGHLCGCLGTMFDSPELADLAAPEQIRPDALGLCYPVAVSWGRTHEGSFVNITGGDAQLRQRLSMDRLVRPDMPPVFLWHTRDDASVPCRNSLILAQAMEEAGVDFALHIYRTGKHGLSTADAMAYPVYDLPQISWDVPGWLEACVRFFEEVGLTVTDKR
jgi:acetyl esterase/lipase